MKDQAVQYSAEDHARAMLHLFDLHGEVESDLNKEKCRGLN